jgi:hypothetical protein
MRHTWPRSTNLPRSPGVAPANMKALTGMLSTSGGAPRGCQESLRQTAQPRGRLALVVNISLLLQLLEPGAAAAPARPGLPDVLTFRLEDGRHGTPGLSLSFALPGLVEYECRRMVFREERQDREIRIVLLDVAPVADPERCRMVKVPAPIRERIVLPTAPGNYQVVFVSGARRDAYTLVVAPDAVTLQVDGGATFTTCAETGKLMRVGPDWLWVDFSFLTDESLRRMTGKRDEVLRALAAVGAKAFTPTPGRYLLDGFVRKIPGDPRSDGGAKDERFFLWDGDWEKLRNLASRYQKHSVVATKRPVMMMWLSSRDNVVSTSDGRVNAHILERPPSAVP